MSPQAPILDVVLRPAPPLPPRALLAILAAVTAINAAFALYFVLHGAWPMLPFMGTDIALLAWAFRASSEAARREERVVLTPSLLSILRRGPKARPSQITLNPYWVRVEVEERAGQASRLLLWSHGRSVHVGSFLPPFLRASFAERLKAALARARTGPA